MPKPGPRCPYCEGSPASELRDAGAVYGQKYEGQFSMWVCVNRPDCDAYVGVVTGSLDAEPAGTLANAELRALRKRAKDALPETGKARGVHVKQKMQERIRQIRLINHSNEDQLRRALMALYQPATKEA